MTDDRMLGEEANLSSSIHNTLKTQNMMRKLLIKKKMTLKESGNEQL